MNVLAQMYAEGRQLLPRTNEAPLPQDVLQLAGRTITLITKISIGALSAIASCATGIFLMIPIASRIANGNLLMEMEIPASTIIKTIVLNAAQGAIVNALGISYFIETENLNVSQRMLAGAVQASIAAMSIGGAGGLLFGCISRNNNQIRLLLDRNHEL